MTTRVFVLIFVMSSLALSPYVSAQQDEDTAEDNGSGTTDETTGDTTVTDEGTEKPETTDDTGTETGEAVKTTVKPATITSDSLKIAKESGWMVYTGNACLRKGEVILSADVIRFNRKEEIAHAEGNVLLIRGQMTSACDKMTYNVKEDTGVAEFVQSYGQSWYGWGEQIIRVSENEYRIEEGYLTTDPYLKPGWRIRAKVIEFYPGDKIVARHVIMYVRDVPVMYLPYYYASLDDKHSPLSVEVGYTETWGYYALVAYDLLIGDGLHIIFHLDYRSKKKWGEGVDIVGYQKSGGYYKAKYYYADDKERVVEIPGTEKTTTKKTKKRDVETETIEDVREAVELEGYHPFGDGWDVRYELHKYSDQDFLKDFYRDDYEENIEPETYINFSKYHPNWVFSVFNKVQANDFYTTTERLPEVSAEYSSTPIGQTPFYHEGVDSISSLNRVNQDKSIEEYDSVRLDNYHRISYPRKYFAWLNIVPGIAFRSTYYSNSKDEEAKTRYLLNADVDFFTKLFKIWEYEDPDRNLHGLRHVIEPNIHYYYTPTPNVEPEELLQFDRIDKLDYENRFRLGLRNKLQTKRYNDVWDLIDLYTYVDYFPNLEKYDGALEDRHFSDVGFDLEIFPSRNMKIDMDAKLDTYDGEITTFNTQLSFFESDQYGVSFEYRYRVDMSGLYAAEGYVRLGYEYAAKAYLRYEAETNELEEAEVTLLKDLRTWVGALSFRHRLAEYEDEEDDNQVWLMFYLKALPETSMLGGN